jgi:hypothetical protein
VSSRLAQKRQQEPLPADTLLSLQIVNSSKGAA